MFNLIITTQVLNRFCLKLTCLYFFTASCNLEYEDQFRFGEESPDQISMVPDYYGYPVYYTKNNPFESSKMSTEHRACRTHEAGRAATLPVFVKFTIGCPTSF